MTQSTATLIIPNETTSPIPPLQRAKESFTLHSEQSYIPEIAQQLGIETRIIYHPYATDTCHEKAQLLQRTHPQEQWVPERVVKALYGVVCWEYYGFVLPEIGKKLDLETLAATFTLAKLEPPRNKRDFYFTKTRIPESMELGTCTPFPTADDMQGIAALFIYDFPSLDKQLVDISLGGRGEGAHRASMQLSYGSIYTILREQFGEKIIKVPFPDREIQERFL